MSDRRQVWQTLSDLLARLEKSWPEEGTAPGAGDGLGEELRKLGKAQFKANVLAEEQAGQWAQSLSAVREVQTEQSRLLQTLQEERAAAASHELLEALLPALDGLENAIASGQGYLEKRDKVAASPTLSPTQMALFSPADRAALAGWLRGLRLVRDRLMAVLEAGGVTPIPALGQPFDPYLHLAVGTASAGSVAPGTIVAEERRGYRTPAGVLRYAEVIVYRPGDGGI